MSFGIYAIGFVIMLIGVVYGAYLMHIPTHWIAVGAIVLLGVGILYRELRPPVSATLRNNLGIFIPNRRLLRRENLP